MKRATWAAVAVILLRRRPLGGRPTRRQRLPARIGLPLGVRFHPIMAFIVGGHPKPLLVAASNRPARARAPLR